MADQRPPIIDLLIEETGEAVDLVVVPSYG
jgi:hypothetical protein